MLKFAKRITRNFSTLIIPDANKLSKDVSILCKAALNFDKDI